MTKKSGGCDNELFRVTVAEGSRRSGWPARVVMRVALNDRPSELERLRMVHVWCTDREYPAPAVFGHGVLADGAPYLILPFVDSASLVLLLARPSQLVSTFVRLHLQLHDVAATDWPGRRRTLDDVLGDITAASARVGPPSAEPIVNWLHDHRDDAADGDDVVCHFDYHPFNLRWSNTREAMVIDWDTAAVGPRVADVAITAELLTLGTAFVQPRTAGRLAELVGAHIADAYLARYTAQHPIDALALRYWRVVQDIHFLLWKHGATLLNTTVRPEVREQWSPHTDRIVGVRFSALTSSRP
jgi:aminoglycoside phosphotransferase (APT) family kinase protein